MYNFPTNVFAAIRSEKDDFLNNQIEIVPGYNFNQYETVKKVHLYYNSKYVDGQYEEINGVKRQKIFFNLSKYRCDVGTKMLDVDVKDFGLISKRPETEWNVNILEKELKAWLKRSKMGKVLNEIVRLLPIYGSVVLKKIKGGAEVVDLRNFFVDQSAKDLESSRYILIKHLLSPAELRKMDGKWENVKQAIQTQCVFTAKSYEGSGEFNKAIGSPYAEVWERYGEVPLSWFTDKEKDSDTWVLSKFIITGVNDTRRNVEGKTYAEDGLILFKEQLKELPFKEVHLNKTEGRWLGIGFVEDTFEAQRMRNRVANLEDRALELASTIVFQTQDPTVVKNITTDVNNGDIFVTKSPINRLDNSQRSLAEFSNASRQYESLADRQTFSADLLSGESPPASATATAIVNQVQQASSVFDYKRENVGLFLQEFVEDLVYPELKKEINKRHLFKYAGSADEVNRLKERIANNVIASASEQVGFDLDPMIVEQEKQRIIDEMSTGGNRIWLEVEDGFFNNIEYEVDMSLTNESRNIQAQLNNVMSLLKMLAPNPDVIMANPVLKRLLFKMLAIMDISSSELETLEQESIENQKAQMEQQQMMAQQQGAAEQTQQQEMGQMMNLNTTPSLVNQL